ncbi:MAG: glycosyltransferase family 9 protein [Phycisphaerae bacterium]
MRSRRIRYSSRLVHAESRFRAWFRKKRGTVLIVRVDAIGDFVLFRPCLPYYKLLFPDKRVVLLTTEADASLLANESLVDQIIPMQRSRFIADPHYQRGFLAELRAAAAEIAVYPTYTREAYVDRLIYALGSRERIAFRDTRMDLPRIRRRNDLFTRLVEPGEKPMHEVERNKEFLQHFGVAVTGYDFSLKPSPADEEFARSVQQTLSPQGPVVVVAPGSSKPRKIWPVKNFIDVGHRLASSFNAVFVLVGSEVELPLGCAFAEALRGRCANLIGATTLLQLYALMKRATIYLGNDTGPKHIAAAAGLPVVEICCHPHGGDPAHFNSPVRFGAYGVPRRVLQPEPLPPCSRFCSATDCAHCIANNSPEAAFHGAMELLTDWWYPGVPCSGGVAVCK